LLGQHSISAIRWTDAYSELRISHRKGTGVLEGTFALLGGEDAIGSVPDYVASVDSEIAGRIHDGGHGVRLLMVSMAKDVDRQETGFE
jgi:hypothetical protein